MKQEVVIPYVLLADFSPEHNDKLITIAGILNDLDTTIKCLERLKSLKSGTDQTTLDSYWTTAIVMYARCFASGDRRRDIINTLKDGLEPTTETWHNNIINLRNKHIAHSENIFEQTQIMIWLSPFKPRQVTSIAPFTLRHDALNIETLEQFSKVARTMHTRAVDLMTAISNEALAAVRKLPIQKLYRKAKEPRPRFELPTIDDVTKTRKPKPKP